jgi:hypothetical protein
LTDGHSAGRRFIILGLLKILVRPHGERTRRDQHEFHADAVGCFLSQTRRRAAKQKQNRQRGQPQKRF